MAAKPLLYKCAPLPGVLLMRVSYPHKTFSALLHGESLLKPGRGVITKRKIISGANGLHVPYLFHQSCFQIAQCVLQDAPSGERCFSSGSSSIFVLRL